MRTSRLPTAHHAAAATAETAVRRIARSTSRDAGGPMVLDRYRLLARLGAGAFGTVWHARDERLERDVAVKILPRERIVGGRFEREAKAAARLAHPGIVTLYEAAVDDDGAYLVSELVRGRTFEQLLADGALSDRDIVRVGIALCDALQHAHAHGVVHRDVKPSNILIPQRVGTPAQAAKLTDFGVARVVGGDTLTRTGDVVGTMAYMAPEQAEGRPAGEPADLYSTALVLYEALTGVNPVLTRTVAVQARRLGAYLPPLRRQRRDLPRELGQGIDLALRPRAGERGALGELKQALSRSLELVPDQPGVVESGWPAWTSGWASAEPTPEPAVGRPRRLRLRRQRPLRSPQSAADRAPPASARWPTRGLGAAAAAALAAWAAAHPLAPLALAPAAAALFAGLLALALPRVGWLTLVLMASVVAAVQGHPGLSLVVVMAGLVPVALIPRGGGAWPLPAVCPALGMLGLAGAWPALAGRAGSAWRRSALAVAGWVWLLIASPLTGHTLYVRSQAAPAPAGWSSSVSSAAVHLLIPLLRPGLLAPAAAWALGAATLPLVRRRTRAASLLAGTAWALAVVAATAALTGLGGDRHGLVLGGEAVLGAAAGLVVALAPDLPAIRGRSAEPQREPQPEPGSEPEPELA